MRNDVSEVAQVHLHDAFANYLRNVLAEGLVDRSTCLEVLVVWRETSNALNESLVELTEIISTVGLANLLGESNAPSEDVRIGEEGGEVGS